MGGGDGSGDGDNTASPTPHLSTSKGGGGGDGDALTDLIDDYWRKRKPEEDVDTSRPQDRLKLSLIFTEEELSDIFTEEELGQCQAIAAEQATNPFVGNLVPVSDLSKDFSQEDLTMQEKIKFLGGHYANLRRIGRDGNCFFRSFMFGYMESVLATQNIEEVGRLTTRMTSCGDVLKDLGFRAMDYDLYFVEFLKQVHSLIDPAASLSHEQLLLRSCARVHSNYAVMCLRFAASAEILKKCHFYQTYLTGGMTVGKFCEEKVHRMGIESDDMQLGALTMALGVPLRVLVLERDGLKTVTEVIYPGGYVTRVNQKYLTSNQPEPPITLLKRPGHYEILYK